MLSPFFISIKSLVILVPLLASIAYFTLAERKVLATLQRRMGPNVVGIWGTLQPLSDGLKLFTKEHIIPSNANKEIFIVSPLITFYLSLLGWAVIPFDEGVVFADLNLGVIYLLAISSLGVYGIIMAGWSSNSKYAFLGAIRSAAQMVSYEVSFGFIISTVIICSDSFNLTEIVNAQKYLWYVVPLFPSFVSFLISALAETNRHPFDLPEAEAELVSGYNVEYASMGFALFSLGEYSNILLMSAIATHFFLGGWISVFPLYLFPLKYISPGFFLFSLKLCLFVVFFILARGLLPRYRYDQLMDLGWKCLLPFSIFWLLFVTSSLFQLKIIF